MSSAFTGIAKVANTIDPLGSKLFGGIDPGTIALKKKNDATNQANAADAAAQAAYNSQLTAASSTFDVANRRQTLDQQAAAAGAVGSGNAADELGYASPGAKNKLASKTLLG